MIIGLSWSYPLTLLALCYDMAIILADERNSGSTHDRPHDVKFDRTPSLFHFRLRLLL